MKKQILALFSALLCTLCLLKAQTFVQAPTSTSISGTSETIAFTGITAGDSLVVEVQVANNITGQSISDSQGNTTWKAAILENDTSGGQFSAIYWLPSAAGGSDTITFNDGGTTHTISLEAQEYSPLGSVDVTKEGIGSGTSAASGAVSTTNANDLLIGSCSAGGSITSGTSGYTLYNNTKGAGEYKIVSSTGSQNSTFTLPSNTWDSVFAAFEPSVSPTPTPTPTPTPAPTCDTYNTWNAELMNEENSCVTPSQLAAWCNTTVFADPAASPTPTPTPVPTPTPTPTPPASPLPSNASYTWEPGLTGGNALRGGIPGLNGVAAYTTVNYSGANTFSGIQTALNALSANQALVLPAGNYTGSSTPLTLKVNNTALIGGGTSPASTTLTWTGTGSDAIVIGNQTGWAATSIAITGGATQGSSSITAASKGSLAVGDIVCISESTSGSSWATNDGEGSNVLSWAGAPNLTSGGNSNDTTRLLEQVDKVTSISGTGPYTINLERPLYLALSSSPYFTYMAPSVGIGLQNVEIVWNTNEPNNYNNVDIYDASECWIENVYSNNQAGKGNYAHVYLWNDYAIEIRECWFQGGDTSQSGSGSPNESGSDYGVYTTNNVSDCLIEDNIFSGVRHSTPCAGGGSGNVYAYNYSFGNFDSTAVNYLTQDLAMHGAEPYCDLFEGNVASCVGWDDVWGGNGYNTAFRNSLLGYSNNNLGPSTQALFCCEMNSTTYSPNIIGNVYGRSGVSGESDYGNDSGTSGLDSTVALTITKAYNYSYNSNSVVDGTVAGGIPPSLYYTATPFWWTNGLAWPIIGPDCTPYVGSIPAETRYQAGTK
jgi:hypothetical protein